MRNTAIAVLENDALRHFGMAEIAGV